VKNAIEFDSGVQSNPDDGVVGLLYTTGKMAFVNSSNNIADVGDGALARQHSRVVAAIVDPPVGDQRDRRLQDR